jgi:hypothetical protein
LNASQAIASVAIALGTLEKEVRADPAERRVHLRVPFSATRRLYEFMSAEIDRLIVR